MSTSPTPAPPPAYLTALLAPYTAPPPPARPHVTLTFAQSLDGKIAGAGGAQLALSGAESMRMTHWLRTMHDAILVGIGTALNDDPQLNTRHLPPDAVPHRAPRPVVLDSRLRLPTTCKLLRNHSAGAGRRPWVVGVAPVTADADWQARSDVLTAAGARVLLLPAATAHDPSALLALLRAEGIQSLMVEGGARVIATFLGAAECIDTLLITTAPLLVGGAGVGYAVPEGTVRRPECRLWRDAQLSIFAIRSRCTTASAPSRREWSDGTAWWRSLPREIRRVIRSFARCCVRFRAWTRITASGPFSRRGGPPVTWVKSGPG
ncbi:dihydrofolate reductase-like domain-containing protein [Mycena latifolia]|nr:dihydrofolate reductase-like domain-containing protein [Mycena latifolia]